MSHEMRAAKDNNYVDYSHKEIVHLLRYQHYIIQEIPSGGRGCRGRLFYSKLLKNILHHLQKFSTILDGEYALRSSIVQIGQN